MVEINYNKKNIIILFISMSVFLFFIYKGFIADSSQYLEEYKNYLLKINASKYYFDKLEKNKTIKEKEDKTDENKKINELLLIYKKSLNNSININDKIIKNLENINFDNIMKIKNILNDTIEFLKQRNKNDSYFLKIFDDYNNNN